MINNKVVIYGYNNLGSKIASILKAKNYEIIIIDYEDKNLENAIKDKHTIYNYSLIEDEELIKLGIKSDIKAFFCVSNSEENNLFTTLSVRNLNKNIKIISIAKTKQDNQKMLLAGATKVINPYEIGALRVLKLLHKPLILEILDDILFGSSSLNLAEFTILKNSKLNNRCLNEFDFSKEFNILVIGIADKELSDKFIFNAKGINHKMDDGDTLVAMGYSKDLKKFKKIIEGENINYDAV